MSNHQTAAREDATDYMAEYEGFGEMRSYTDALGNEQVAFTWRRMPPGTGGRGSYGHRHQNQEEVLFVISGEVTVKVDDQEEFTLGPRDAVRFAPEAVRSIHNDGGDEAEVVLVSTRLDDPVADAEMIEGFWPED